MKHYLARQTLGERQMDLIKGKIRPLKKPENIKKIFKKNSAPERLSQDL